MQPPVHIIDHTLFQLFPCSFYFLSIIRQIIQHHTKINHIGITLCPRISSKIICPKDLSCRISQVILFIYHLKCLITCLHQIIDPRQLRYRKGCHLLCICLPAVVIIILTDLLSQCLSVRSRIFSQIIQHSCIVPSRSRLILFRRIEITCIWYHLISHF